jgi:hypothetical protein
VRLHARRTLDWPRIGVYTNDTLARFRVKVSPLGRWLIGRPSGEALLRFALRR